MLDGENWSPSPEKSLGELGVGHKSLIRFWTQEGGNA
jgi:phenol hydroxylase P4 protein